MLPAFIRFYPSLTPEAFWRLEMREYDVLKAFMLKAAEAANQSR